MVQSLKKRNIVNIHQDLHWMGLEILCHLEYVKTELSKRVLGYLGHKYKGFKQHFLDFE